MAKLLGGTRIYGTANVDTSLYLGTSNTTTGTGGILANTTVLFIGNNTDNAYLSSSSIAIGTVFSVNTTVVNTSANLNVANILTVGNSTVNTFSNSTHFYSGNSTVYGYGNNTADVLVNASGNLVLTATSVTLSNTTAAVFTANVSQITFAEPAVHTANVSVNGAIIANGGAGTSGQVLTSAAGGNVYWASASGGFTNGQSISVSNLAVTGVLSANGGTGTAGQALISGGAGNTYWGVLSPGYNYSSQFNGAANFFAFASNAAFALGTGDFTIECWVYPIALAGGTTYQPLIDFRNSNQGVYSTLYISGSTVNYYTNSSNRITAGSTLSNNNWYHVAVVRISGSTKLYINGVQSGSTYTDSNSYLQGPVSIGNFNDGAGNAYINALISNARVVKGTGVYTGNFTVPSSPLSAISGTVLLTCNSISPSDSSSYNFSPLNNGVVLGTATQSPFTSTTVSIPTAALTSVRQQFTGDGSTTQYNIAGGYTPNSISVFVNGVLARNGSDVTVTSGSYITFTGITPPAGSLIDVVGTVPTTYSSITPVSYSIGFVPGSSQYLQTTATAVTGTWTIEFWVYNSSFGGADGRGYVFNGTTSSNANRVQMSVGSTGLLYYYHENASAGTFSVTASTAMVLNTWYHVAVVSDGTTLTIYRNGVSVGSGSIVNTPSPGTNFYIGFNRSSGALQYFDGYISNFRYTRSAVYTGAFTPPSSPLQAVQSATAPNISAITGAQTTLLTCNAPTIIDGSTNPLTITTSASAPTVSTAIVPTFTNVTINNAVATATTYSVQALLIAGGGAGGAGEPNPGGDGGGGGGAGGVIQNNINLSVGTVYSIVIGAGGSGGSTTGGTGTNSTFAGLTAYGGGGGGDGNGTIPGSGGSGGGAGNEYNASTWSGGCVYNQGYPGGPSVSASTSWRGGSGGGGAGGFGTSRTSAVGGNGGSSISLAITGSTVWYAGGGGGGGNGTNGGGTGGNGFGANQGGGGNGGTTGAVPGTGTTNTGGGGGGGVGHNVATSYTYGASGGSGVVILSIPTANYTGTKTGSPTVTTNGIYTVLTFTASGTYTA